LLCRSFYCCPSDGRGRLSLLESCAMSLGKQFPTFRVCHHGPSKRRAVLTQRHGLTFEKN
jgi:hypothetical protein